MKTVLEEESSISQCSEPSPTNSKWSGYLVSAKWPWDSVHMAMLIRIIVFFSYWGFAEYLFLTFTCYNR